jgi:type II secretory pathway pseudopilin PulG
MRLPLRRAAILLELVAAIAILAVVMTLVAQTSIWSMRERARNAEHHAALELADNIMEAARARAWEDLTASWAKQQKMGTDWGQRLPDPKLTVCVEPEKTVVLAKRVTVDIRWGAEPSPRSVQLVGLFSPRATLASGGKP